MDKTDQSHWEKVADLFARALELPEADRASFLQNECSDEEGLLTEVQELLAADAARDPIEDIVVAAAQQSVTEKAEIRLDKQIGNYRLLSVLGEGGMGTVYLAERSDDQFRQQVAIKVLNAYRPSKGLIQRLRSERQILANLNHPNIAKLLDGGSTTEDLPYLVIEYISGQPIDQYCDENRLDVAARLRLFCKVCDAVDYAHRNLIVHRDLKPGNILVDQVGEPKLLDFGIAKLLDRQAMAQTMAMTRQGALLLTPQYASPEQVRGESPTIATDVYSLGVLLFRLLTGYSPYGDTFESPRELEKAIVEADPRKPSTVVTAQHTGPDEHQKVDLLHSSKQRSTSPSRLRKRLLGDLDNIVLKSLQKEPQRRYASAQLLHQDIENYLQNRPVLARPDSLPYRVGKSIRRNRLAVAGTAVFVLTITGLVSFYTLQVTQERDRARLEANRAQQVAEFLTNLFEEANPANNFGEPMNARELLDAGAARVTQELDQQPELKAALAATIGDSYIRMRENKTGRDYLRPLVAELEAALGQDNRSVLQLRRLYANSLMHTGDAADAKPIYEKDFATWQRVAGQNDHDTGVAQQRLAVVESLLGNNSEAEAHFISAIRNLRQHGEAAFHDLAEALMTYGAYLRKTDRVEEEVPLLLEALQLHESRVGTEHSDYAAVLNNLGNNHFRRGSHDVAAEYYQRHLELQRKLVGEQGVAYANALANSANLLQQQGRYEASLAMADEAAIIYRTGYGEDSVPYAYLSENRGNVLMDLRRYDESDAAFQIALTNIGKKFGVKHHEYAITQSSYGTMLERAGRLDESILQLTAALDTNAATYGVGHRETIVSQYKLANVLSGRDDWNAALDHASQAVSAARQNWQSPHPDFVNALAALADTHLGRKEFDAAETHYKEAIEMASQLDNEPLRRITTLEVTYSRALIGAGRIEEASSLLRDRAEEIAAFDESWNEIREEIAESLATLSAE